MDAASWASLNDIKLLCNVHNFLVPLLTIFVWKVWMEIEELTKV